MITVVQMTSVDVRCGVRQALYTQQRSAAAAAAAALYITLTTACVLPTPYVKIQCILLPTLPLHTTHSLIYTHAHTGHLSPSC